MKIEQSEKKGLSPKEAWWAGARAGIGLPYNTPRSVVAEQLAVQRNQEVEMRKNNLGDISTSTLEQTGSTTEVNRQVNELVELAWKFSVPGGPTIEEMDDFKAAARASRALPVVEQQLQWTDAEGTKFTFSLAGATQLLAKLYAEWPGGLEEIESAFRTKASRSVQPAEILSDAERQSWELHIEQSSEIRDLLDLHAPETEGNLQTRLAQFFAQPGQLKGQRVESFGEKYPFNPDAKCKCEHWEVCVDCHPTYFNAALEQPAQTPVIGIKDLSNDDILRIKNYSTANGLTVTDEEWIAFARCVIRESISQLADPTVAKMDLSPKPGSYPCDIPLSTTKD